ncbi:hypothetical protein N3K66_007979 [Trichothecium roseum]|uniref:Uncharacterized protein n=1 Tax=Trichothecium roseum TaxID=47278 RepID=A0ACC0UUQ3_9HYPO|nr:hypothetical protein N3K66_007979 [Trichothecium roseum]
MWRPPINFVTLHYAYIILIGLSSFIFLYPEGNLSAINAYHFGVSASTVSGLNVVDLNQLKTYQQLFLYFIPTITNIGFINAVVVLVRLYWFRKHLKNIAPKLLRAKNHQFQDQATPADVEQGIPYTIRDSETVFDSGKSQEDITCKTGEPYNVDQSEKNKVQKDSEAKEQDADPQDNQEPDRLTRPRTRITFDPSADQHPRNDETLYIPGPRERDRGDPLVELSRRTSPRKEEPDEITTTAFRPGLRRRRTDGSRITFAQARSFDRVATAASSVFVIGNEKPRRERRNSTSSQIQQPAINERPFLSKQATLGRNSRFHNLTSEDREALGGIEYRSLKLLLKIVVGYFIGLHIFGALCLVPWIKLAAQKYRDYLAEVGQGQTWWAFYSAQTMVNNLGMTLTPDSMISFHDSEWVMFSMSLIALAGNTFYPVFLRLLIWTMSKVYPRHNSIQEPLHFLLDHPRRCYTLLFPSKPTWVLFGILAALNIVDTLLIVVLDLNNPEVTELPGGKRVLAAIFQSASSRHTGTATFTLSEVSPAVQFSLLVMMYISVFPIAISIRASNTYEEKSLGIYEKEAVEEELGEYEGTSGTSYLLKHMQNQLSFDLWYVFLGIFCICIAEADKIMDLKDPAFNVFSIFFEVTSAYANVGLSLGHPSVNTSLCGRFTTFSKLVTCALMIRGRHRGLPYQLDRAIMLPDQHLLDTVDNDDEDRRSRRMSRELTRERTQPR